MRSKDLERLSGMQIHSGNGQAKGTAEPGNQDHAAEFIKAWEHSKGRAVGKWPVFLMDLCLCLVLVCFMSCKQKLYDN